MLRVAMITDYPADENKVDGGVQAVSKYLAHSIADFEGVKLDIIGFDYSSTRERTIEGARFTRHVLPGARFGALTGYRQDQNSLNRCLKKIAPDIVHSQGVGHDGTVAARSGYPLVTTIHGIFAETHSR